MGQPAVKHGGHDMSMESELVAAGGAGFAVLLLREIGGWIKDMYDKRTKNQQDERTDNAKHWKEIADEAQKGMTRLQKEMDDQEVKFRLELKAERDAHATTQQQERAVFTELVEHRAWRDAAERRIQDLETTVSEFGRVLQDHGIKYVIGISTGPTSTKTPRVTRPPDKPPPKEDKQ